MNKTIVLPALALGAFVAALSLPAAAQAPAKKIGTRDELRACMNSESDLKARQDALRERGKKLGDDATAMSAATAEINDEQKRAETDSSFTGPRRERLERKVRAHNARLKAAQETETAFNAETQALGKDVEAYREKCVNVAFDADDKAAILKEREAAKK